MKRFLLITGILCGIATGTEAQQIFYRDLVPNVTVSGLWPYIPTTSDTVHLAYDGSTPIVLTATIDTVNGAYIACTGGNCEVLNNTSLEPLAISNQAYIDSNAQPWNSTGAPQGKVLYDPNQGTGDWQNVFSKFLGFRFEKSGQTFYGWVRMDVSWAPGSGLFTLNVRDYAYEQTAGMGITTDETLHTDILPAKQEFAVTVQNKTIYIHNLYEPFQYQVVDMGGRVFSKGDRKYAIPMEKAGAGIYILKVWTSNRTITRKVLID